MSNHKNVSGCAVAAVVPLILCALVIWLPQLYNNWQLHRFAGHLFDYHLPPQTEVISTQMDVGLRGNGNHCDFLARQTMRTRLAAGQIEAYYEEVSFPPVRAHNEGRALDFQGQPIPVYVDFDSTTFEDGWLNFTIELSDFGYDAGLDWRCH